MTRVVKWASAIGYLMLACVFVLLSGHSLYAQSEQSSPRGSLAGAWWVNVTLYNCKTGAKNPPFASLLAFARGGTMSETTANPAFQPGQRTSGYGTWSHASGGSYESTDEAFILFTGGPFTQGTQKINHSITVADDGDHFNDDATVRFLDIHGKLLGSGCARAVGTRLQ